MNFPAFRSIEWINTTFNINETKSQKNNDFPPFFVPPQILRGVELFPQDMKKRIGINLFKQRRIAVQQEIRRALFRQALFKVQNVEVMYLSKCGSNRVIHAIQDVQQPREIKLFRSPGTELLKEEIWTINRCNKFAKYSVRYYQEDANGYSVSVRPKSIIDKLQELRFSYFSPIDEDDIRRAASNDDSK